MTPTHKFLAGGTLCLSSSASTSWCAVLSGLLWAACLLNLLGMYEAEEAMAGVAPITRGYSGKPNVTLMFNVDWEKSIFLPSWTSWRRRMPGQHFSLPAPGLKRTHLSW